MSKHPDGNQTKPGLAAALRALRARKGPATEADRPRRKSERPDLRDGQLDLDGNVYELDRPQG
jgi:hypothetical protein